MKDQFRHCKPILALGGAVALLQAAGIPDGAPGIVHVAPAETEAGIEAFTRLLAGHRVYERETDPPTV